MPELGKKQLFIPDLCLMFNPRSQPIIVENTREIVRLKAYDPYFSKIKKIFHTSSIPLISARIEEGHFLKFLKMLKIAIFTLPQLLQESQAIEVGCKNFLFLKNMNHKLSNAPFPI